MKSLVLAISMSVATLAACGGGNATSGPANPGTHPNPPEEKAPGEKAKGPMKAPGDAAVGDTTKCPVSGEEFVVDANSPKVEHGGKTYFFCCNGCRKKFEADPAKYLNKT